MKRWHFLHVTRSDWGQPPEPVEIPLEFEPGPDTMSYVVPGLLVVRAVGGIHSEREVYGVDPLNGSILWRFSHTDEDLLFFSCHVETTETRDTRIIASTRHGVYQLTREGPQSLLAQALDPASVARLAPSGEVGYVLDEKKRMVAFDPQRKEVLWSRRAPKQVRFQNPFPLDDGSLCFSSGGDVRRLSGEGELLWKWPETPYPGIEHAIERYVQPDLLLIRSHRTSDTVHLTLHVDTGEELAALGDVWAYGADGVTEHPVVLFEGMHEQIAFLNPDGTCTTHQKARKLFGGFRDLPEGCFAIYYDALMKMIVCTDQQGEVRWKQNYPDSEAGLAATYFGQEAIYFATRLGTLHVWDFGA